jgi:hypothetical protein
MDGDSRTIIEESRQLIATARRVVAESRTVRAAALAACGRADRILRRAHEAAIRRAVQAASRDRMC